jgi:hypothetical protein
MPIPIDRLIRSPRRTIALIIRQNGTLEVRAPLHMAETQIQEFVRAHTHWISRKQAQARLAAPLPPRQYQAGESFPFLGQLYPLLIVPRQRPALFHDGLSFHLAQAAQPRAAQHFVRWYREQASKLFSERVQELARVHGFSYQKVRISSARTRWGSCSPKGTLSFTWRLVLAPPGIIDYVLIHELVHTRVPNHSRAFWQGVAEILPDYTACLSWLRKNGRSLSLD